MTKRQRAMALRAMGTVVMILAREEAMAQSVGAHETAKDFRANIEEYEDTIFALRTFITVTD
jgi:hypothetical protein